MTSCLISRTVLKRLLSFNKLFVGFSGGLDSTVLLHDLAQNTELRAKIVAIHINHGLHQCADEWQDHCYKFAMTLGVPFISRQVKIKSNNIESAARDARKGVFQNLVRSDDAILLAHHQQDQAETVLLRLMRGAGVDGLSAMQMFMQYQNRIYIRPLLDTPRVVLEDYVNEHALNWVEDSSNQNNHFARNFIRNEILPKLSQKWPSASRLLANTAKHCQQAQDNLEYLAHLDSQSIDFNNDKLPIALFNSLHYARVVNILRRWLNKHDILMPSSVVLSHIIKDVISCNEDRTPVVNLGDFILRRAYGYLYLTRSREFSVENNVIWQNFPDSLRINQEKILTAQVATNGVSIPDRAVIEVRFRAGGEKIRLNGQTKSLKKLLQVWKIPHWQRSELPLLYINRTLAAVVGYAVSDDFYAESGSCYRFEVA